jgi:hypothetical protein
VKFIDAQQAKTIHKFQRIKEKIHKTNAAIWFNKLCKTEHLTPRYINITVNGNTQRSRNTQKAATTHRITQEIKFLYKKKCELNEQLYKTHLQCANYWQNSWSCIQNMIQQKLEINNDIHYNKLNKKLDALRQNQRKTTKTHSAHTFYERVKMGHRNNKVNSEKTVLVHLLVQINQLSCLFGGF